MEEETFYDSIDDTNYTSFRSFPESHLEEESIGIHDLVPFYTGNVEKSEVNSIKNDSRSNSCTELKDKSRKRIIAFRNNERRKNRSYLTMFYERSGLKGKTEGSISSRATCRELSPKSYLSCDRTSCYFNEHDYSERVNPGKSPQRGKRPIVPRTNGGVSSSLTGFICAIKRSFYEKFLEKEKARDGPDNTQSKPQYAICMSCSVTTLDTKLYSVSETQMNVHAVEVTKQTTNKTNKTKCKAKPTKTCELGGLGPNIAQEKLELLRKRQDYGRIASEKNRIKMIETKVVQKLREEIRESNKV